MEIENVLNVNNLPVNDIDVAVAPQTPAPPHSQVEGLVEKEEAESIVREYVKKFNHKQRRPNRRALKRKRERDKRLLKAQHQGCDEDDQQQGCEGEQLTEEQIKAATLSGAIPSAIAD